MASLYSCKQTLKQLAQQYGRTAKTIQWHLQKHTAQSRYAAPSAANVIMDTTYFGRSFGIMVLYDSISKQAHTYVAGVPYETNTLYAAALQAITTKGIEIQSIVCDGRQGLLQLHPHLPSQLCHPTKSASSPATLPDAHPSKAKQAKRYGCWH